MVGLRFMRGPRKRSGVAALAVVAAVVGCGGPASLSEDEDQIVQRAAEAVDSAATPPRDRRIGAAELSQQVERLERALGDERSDTLVPSQSDKPVGDLLANMSLSLSFEGLEAVQQRIRALRERTQDNAGKESVEF